MRKLYFFVFTLLFACCFSFSATAQQDERSAGHFLHELKKLRKVQNVLYLAAHPDDENQRLITYFANERQCRTAYLSLTRGDGGQNLIGPEVREELGLIRTQELLAARNIDGGEQFFSRANDFGYSKNPEETFTIWDKKQVLGDVVRVIRQFRPDIIVTRFSPTRGRTHGHHTASAQLAVEAFELAGNPEAYPEQLEEGLTAWQPARLFWNTSWWFFRGQDFDKTGLLSIDVGGYNPLIGKSYGELAMAARSMHKCQGFGAYLQRGENIEYLQLLAGDSVTKDPLEGIPSDWGRVRGSRLVDKHLREAIANFSPEKPEKVIPQLIEVHKILKKLNPSPWVNYKIKKTEDLILWAMGFFGEATTSEPRYALGDSLDVRLELLNRSEVPMRLAGYALQMKGEVQLEAEDTAQLLYNKNKVFSQKIILPATEKITQPYWLSETPEGIGMYKVSDKALRGKPEADAPLQAKVKLMLGENSYELETFIPVKYKENLPEDGERYRPLVLAPAVTATPDTKALLFAGKEEKTLKIRLKAHKQSAAGELKISLPEGWEVSQEKVDFSLKKEEEKEVTLQLRAPEAASTVNLSLQVQLEGKAAEAARAFREIDYAHIPVQVHFPATEVKLTKLDLKKAGERIGYLMGAGDEVPEALTQIGYQVEVLDPETLNAETLQNFDAVVAGVRAYNTVPRMAFLQSLLMDYVEKGGTYIIQYNTSFRLVTEDLAPYPLKLSRDRVTVEEAEVTLLAPEHPVLHFPNKITDKDFENWVQERGLYFPNEWSEEFTPILSCHDPNETPKQGGLLIAKHGKGHFVYTGFSWFRQLPAGVPGAYRIFVNLLSLGQEKK